jgi:hypothetical protein
VPDECVVWATKDAQITGQVYMHGHKASFTAGASRRDVGWLTGDVVVVATDAGTIEAARWDGTALEILYIEDSEFASETFGNGRVIVRSDLYKSEFHYNGACDLEDAAVGVATLMTVIFRPGEPTTL